METVSLTGAQKTYLRGLGQTTQPSLKVGKAGLSHTLQREFALLLESRELVKLRFEGADRRERAALIAQIEAACDVPCVGAVGHTALFFRQNPDPEKRTITLP